MLPYHGCVHLVGDKKTHSEARVLTFGLWLLVFLTNDYYQSFMNEKKSCLNAWCSKCICSRVMSSRPWGAPSSSSPAVRRSSWARTTDSPSGPGSSTPRWRPMAVYRTTESTWNISPSTDPCPGGARPRPLWPESSARRREQILSTSKSRPISALENKQLH